MKTSPTSPRSKSSREKNRTIYVLSTVAYNEGSRIENTITCVIGQTCRPKRWLIISDGSTDNTDEIIIKYSKRYPWIQYQRQEKTNDPFQKYERASYAYSRAMTIARSRFAALDYEFHGNLDADITFSNDYFERLIEKALKDQKLGIVGGGAYSVYEGKKLVKGGFIQPDFVGGPVQFFRRQCLDDIDGYFPYGNADVVAVFMARMKGWKVRCFPEIRAFHHGQPENSVRVKAPICFRLGEMDYIMGGYPPFILGRCLLRIFHEPPVFAGLAMLAGYIWASFKKPKRHLPKELISFMKYDQKKTILKYLGFISNSHIRS